MIKFLSSLYKNFDVPVENKYSAPHCELITPLPRMRIEVADTGCGIKADDQQRIFDRFFRVEDSVHTEVGTGLGLSIVRGIIEKHGGQIRMVSSPGVGTTFWFDLPLEHADVDELQLLLDRKNIRKSSDSL